MKIALERGSRPSQAMHVARVPEFAVSREVWAAARPGQPGRRERASSHLTFSQTPAITPILFLGDRSDVECLRQFGFIAIAYAGRADLRRLAGMLMCFDMHLVVQVEAAIVLADFSRELCMIQHYSRRFVRMVRPAFLACRQREDVLTRLHLADRGRAG